MSDADQGGVPRGNRPGWDGCGGRRGPSGIAHTGMLTVGSYAAQATQAVHNCGARTSAQCHSVFPKVRIGPKLWGSPPDLRGSPAIAAALDPPVANEFQSIQTKQADQGVCRTMKANWAISGNDVTS